MKRFTSIVMLSVELAASGAGAAATPMGQWKTVDEKSGAVCCRASVCPGRRFAWSG
jgi:hypothetical protein